MPKVLDEECLYKQNLTFVFVFVFILQVLLALHYRGDIILTKGGLKISY